MQQLMWPDTRDPARPTKMEALREREMKMTNQNGEMVHFCENTIKHMLENYWHAAGKR